MHEVLMPRWGLCGKIYIHISFCYTLDFEVEVEQEFGGGAKVL